ncbi:hypothetical protein HMPREF2873_05100 [Staphylococcus sp. HMSC075H09]|nr:hypothetical protein HMPREF2873_05100 [Staphylococcus sp. HMSC075H09]
MQVNKYVYSALAFFLGGFGTHKFYVKKNKKALLYLLFCWTGIPGVIGMVEGVSTIIRPSDSENNIEIK